MAFEPQLVLVGSYAPAAQPGIFLYTFDPATGIWLKREASVYRGNQVPPQMVTAIKLP